MDRARWPVALALAMMAAAPSLCLAPPASATASVIAANPISAVEGQQFSGVVATIAACRAGDYTATIDWGDGTSLDTGINPAAEANGICVVSGSHTYAEEGSDQVMVTVTSASGGGTGTATATVTDAPLAVVANSIAATAGTAFSGALATLVDTGGMEPPAHYVATIDWGDGSSSAGSLSAAGIVTGSHTYAAAGTDSLHVTVTDDGGATTKGTASAQVSSPPIPPPPPPMTVTPTCVAPGAPAPAPAFTPTGATPQQRYVQALYHDLLGRPADPTALASFTMAMSLGLTRAQVAQAILSSAEYRQDLITGQFQDFLHRNPDPPALTAFLPLLGSGLTDEGLAGQLLGTGEYFANRGGSTIAGWAAALYCDLLGRSPSASEATAAQGMAGGASGRAGFAGQVLGSAEYRTRLLSGWYERFLRRALDTTGRNVLLAAMQTGATDEDVIALIVSSQEYFSHLGGAVNSPISPAVLSSGIIHLVLAHPATVRLVVLRLTGPVLPPGTGVAPTALPAAAAPVHVTLPHTRLVGSVGFGRHPAGRVRLHWNRRVHGRSLAAGRYLLLLQTSVGGRVAGVSDPIPFTVKGR